MGNGQIWKSFHTTNWVLKLRGLGIHPFKHLYSICLPPSTSNSHLLSPLSLVLLFLLLLTTGVHPSSSFFTYFKPTCPSLTSVSTYSQLSYSIPSSTSSQCTTLLALLPEGGMQLMSRIFRLTSMILAPLSQLLGPCWQAWMLGKFLLDFFLLPGNLTKSLGSRLALVPKEVIKKTGN